MKNKKPLRNFEAQIFHMLRNLRFNPFFEFLIKNRCIRKVMLSYVGIACIGNRLVYGRKKYSKLTLSDTFDITRLRAKVIFKSAF